MKGVAPYLVLPAVVGGGTALVWGALQVARGMATSVDDNALRMAVFTASLFAMFGVILVLERVLPYRASWNARDGQLWQDLGHTALGTGVGARLGHVVNAALFVPLGAALGTTDAGLSTLPLWGQLPIVFLAADLGRYVQHRIHHKVPVLWRFHALHHDVSKLAQLKNSRSHILERLLQAVFMFGPLVAAGASAEAIYWYMVSNSFLGMLDHSNVDVRLGPLEYVVTGPLTHRIHHSKDPVEGNSNFGSAIVLWDQLFGTWLNPYRRGPVVDVGVSAPQPTGFFAQVVAPFRPSVRL